jgi:hypothetical protein
MTIPICRRYLNSRRDDGEQYEPISIGTRASGEAESHCMEEKSEDDSVPSVLLTLDFLAPREHFLRPT